MSFTEAIVTVEDKLHYLRQSYFGKYQEDCFSVASNRAFRDMCRTIREASYKKIPKTLKDSVKKDITLYIQSQIEFLEENYQQMDNLDSFDAWHKETCEKIIEMFSLYPLSYGQAQKWLNMTCKNLLALDNQAIRGMLLWLHVPIDKDILDIAEANGWIVHSKEAWSHWDYGAYIRCQKAIREGIEKSMGYGYPPMVWEFRSWNNTTEI